MMEKSIPVEESIPVPEAKSMIGKMIVEHSGVTEAAEMSPEMPSTKAAKVPPTKMSPTEAAMHGGRTQS
jgi:hypothetical protein